MADLDLRDLAPPDLSFIAYNGEEHFIPGDLAVETIIEALQLRKTFDAAANEDDEEAMVEAMASLQAIVRNMLDDCGKLDGRPYPRLGIEAITHVLALAMSGAAVEKDDTPESLVAEALRASPAEIGEDEGEGSDLPPTEPEGAQEKPPAASRTRSRKPSRARSSASA